MMWKAASRSEIRDGSGVAVAVGGRSIAIFNLGGEFHAISNICPHRGASLADGAVEGCKVICPWHGWEFDIRTGKMWMGEGVESYPLQIEGEDIWVEIDRGAQGGRGG